ncbi:hypothetical protein [Henriciella aquimarina]|uniref:hypothetical protein n=1 Tax=Henriciella aquimarina TaxID=545261 RepID=UPI0009FDB6B9|nr:hypothetical protein [Henriciella aquimarina]
MAINWPANARKSFGSDILQASHTLDQSPLFCDAALAALLDAYPRDQLGIWTFGEHGEGEEAPVRGRAPDLSGEELMQAVRRGRIWLNLRAVNAKVSDYGPTADAIFGSLEQASGQKVFKRDMGVLISSPGVNVHYHLDIPLVSLFQIRGEKTMWVYPATVDFAPDERLESIVLREQEEGLTFRQAFETSARRIDMKPGMAVTWPQTAPHRVQNGDMLNVSLSCEFMTLPGLIRANALYANGKLRRQFGAHPKRPNGLTPATLGKAALARLMKQAEKRRIANGPTPATFELDLSAANCVRPLSGVEA